MMAHKASAITTALRRATLGIAGATVVSAAVAGSILPTAASSSIRLLSVTTQGAAVVIEATEPVAYTVSRPDPLTLLVDLRNVAVAEATTRVDPKGPITALRLEQATAPDGLGVARVRISLARAAEYKVRSSRNAIRVELSGPSTALGAGPSTPLGAGPAAAAAPVAPATPPVVPASREAALSPVRTSGKPDAPGKAARPAAVAEDAVVPVAMATSIERVRTTRNGRSTIVTISGNGRLTPTGVTESRDLPRRVILDFPNVTPAAPGPTPGDGELVRRVRVALNNNTPLVTRVVMEISDAATYTVRRNSPTERELTLVFDRPSPAGTAGSVAAKEDAALAAFGGETITLAQALVNGAPLAPPTDAMSSSDAMSALKTSGALAARAAATPAATGGAPAQPPAPAPATPQAPAPAPTTPAPATSPILQPNENQIATGQEKKYTGHPISMDFQGVDLRSVLRTFAEISGLNMVIDPDVQGTVDIVLTDVPWDQALSVILGGNQLDYTVDGTIVRIAKIETLRREQDARTQLAQSAANAGALAVRTYTLSYAKADQAAPLVRTSVLSPRGNVQVDTRTNTLIITDLPARLDTVTSLLSAIDRAEPQVEIEARIITTTRDYARALGVQWGFNGRVNSTIGNTTNLTFPNNGSLGGRLGPQGAGANDPRSNPLDAAGTVVNLGAEAASSAIGLALGSINGAFNLDVALSALERQGKGRILSTPRVTTQNNVEAEITQGVQIPVQTEANNTITVTFKDAALTLKVTPQITAANTVIMQITLENATPGTPVQGIPSINTQRAITRVQVSDGMTTVMGGIFVSRESTVNDRTPVLHRIPFLGWLFKRDNQTDSSDELLIFITPRIQKG
jgi:type IV pilus secretin PilQ/predicted competence protein